MVTTWILAWCNALRDNLARLTLTYAWNNRPLVIGEGILLLGVMQRVFVRVSAKLRLRTALVLAAKVIQCSLDLVVMRETPVIFIFVFIHKSNTAAALALFSSEEGET